MVQGEGSESAGGLNFLTEVISFGVTIWMIDATACDGKIRKWVGRKLRGLVTYAAMALDAANAGRETIAEAERLIAPRQPR